MNDEKVPALPLTRITERGIENADGHLVDEHGNWVLDLGPLGYRQPSGREMTEAGVHTMAATEDWYTAPSVVEAARELFGGTIDLDPMSCEEANEVVRATRIYTAEDDGFVREWHGNLLLNPPWNNSARAIDKLLVERSLGHVSACVCVLNANSLTTRWFEPLLTYPLCVPSYRIAHYAPRARGGFEPVARSGKAGKSAPSTGTVLVLVTGMKQGQYGLIPGADGLIPRFAAIFSDLGAILTLYRPASAKAALASAEARSANPELDW
jgi:hypothetical protein